MTYCIFKYFLMRDTDLNFWHILGFCAVILATIYGIDWLYKVVRKRNR